MAPLLIAGAVAGAGALGKFLKGASQQRQAHRINRSNPFQVEALRPEYAKNVAEAEAMSRSGLPQQQYNNALQNFQRNQNAGLRAFSRSGRTGGLATLLRATNDATMNLDVADANARMGNQRFAMGQRGILANEQKRLFDVNKRQNWLQQLAKANALQGAGIQNQFGAFNDLSQLGTMLAMGAQGGGGTMGQLMGNPSLDGVSAIPKFGGAQWGTSPVTMGGMTLPNNSAFGGITPQFGGFPLKPPAPKYNPFTHIIK